MEGPAKMTSNVYATLFEQHLSSRKVSSAPALTFGSSAWSLPSLQTHVDLFASSLATFVQSSMFDTSKNRSLDVGADVLLAVQEQHVAEYTIALLACLKLSLTVVLVDSAKVSSQKYIDAVLASTRPQLILVDQGAHPSIFAPDRTIALVETASLRPHRLPSLARLCDGSRSKPSSLQQEEATHFRQALISRGMHNQGSLLTPVDESNASRLRFLQASQSAIVAGITTASSILLKSIQSRSISSTVSCLPLHLVSHLTLSIFAPLHAATQSVILPTETRIDSITDSRGSTHLWMSAIQAQLLTKQLSLQRIESFSPASIGILQPGIGTQNLDTLASLLPVTHIWNALAPTQSTGLLFLSPRSRDGVLFGSVANGHRITVKNGQTGKTVATARQGLISIEGPSVMSDEGHSPVVDDLHGIMHADSTLELIMNACACLEDAMMAHPHVKDCCALLVDGRINLYASSLRAQAGIAFAQELSAWAAQKHPSLSEAARSVAIVPSIPRTASGTVLSLHTLPSTKPSAKPASQAVSIAAATKTELPVARRAKTAAILNTKASIRGEALFTDDGPGAKKPVRDSKRRATHSQIERRRREKINDRLVTLRSIVPACLAEVEERKRVKREEEEEARRIAAGEIVPGTAKGKRRRNRRRAAKAQGDGEKEDELGLHKLEVLTHAIEYIYELQDRIEELETGSQLVRPRKVLDLKDILDEGEEGGEILEDDDEDGSEANLEMGEWKPSVKRKAGDAPPPGLPDMSSSIYRRRSTLSSDMSSYATSPAVMSLSAESPMFSTMTNSSASAFTNLTSPMMSLSSESPIMRWERSNDNTASPSSGVRGDKDACKKRKQNASLEWRLPAPALSFEEATIRDGKMEADHDGEAAREAEQSTKKLTSSAQDAHLLLHLSTSPEVLHPTSAVRHSHPPRKLLHRRLSMSTSVGGEKKNIASQIGGSAPGGAHASLPNTLLVSPPLLALDAPLSSVDEQDNMQLDEK